MVARPQPAKNLSLDPQMGLKLHQMMLSGTLNPFSHLILPHEARKWPKNDFRKISPPAAAFSLPFSSNMRKIVHWAPYKPGTGNCFHPGLANSIFSLPLPRTSPDPSHNTPTDEVSYTRATPARRPRPGLFSPSTHNIHFSPKNR